MRLTIELEQPTGSWKQTHSFDAAKRLSTVGSSAGIFTYSYSGIGNHWTNLVVPTTSNGAITNAYSAAGRLTE